MKTLALLLLFSVAALAAPDLNKPIAELKLNSGRVLKNVEIVSYAATAVMAKWEGGRGTIRYEDFPDEYRAALASGRPSEAPPPPQPSAPVIDRIYGQVYAITRGAGAYKFPGVTVVAYPLEMLPEATRLQQASVIRMKDVSYTALMAAFHWTEALKNVPKVAQTTTDADGNYVLTPPPGKYFLFCFASRDAGGEREHNIWVAPVMEPRLDLNSRNEWRPQKR